MTDSTDTLTINDEDGNEVEVSTTADVEETGVHHDAVLFPTDDFLEAGLTDDEAQACALSWTAQTRDLQLAVIGKAAGSLTARKAAVKAWREHTGGNAWVGLPGATDDGPLSADEV